MLFNLERVRANARQATTTDLLDRVTVYREELEPAALEVIEAELRSRGVTAADMEQHLTDYLNLSALPADEVPPRCSRCPRPAVGARRGWHKLLGVLPLFPRTFYFCADHRPTD